MTKLIGLSGLPPGKLELLPAENSEEYAERVYREKFSVQKHIPSLDEFPESYKIGSFDDEKTDPRDWQDIQWQ